MIEKHRLLTVTEVAKYYGVDRSTVFRWTKEGMPHTLAPSGRKRYKIFDIEQWQKSQKSDGD